MRQEPACQSLPRRQAASPAACRELRLALADGGEKDSASFEVSKLKAGEQYMFYCSFPGHAAIMKGSVELK